jgi:hypothetical protein
LFDHFDQICVTVNKPILLHWSWKWETPRLEFSLDREDEHAWFLFLLYYYCWTIVAMIQHQQRNSIYTMEVPWFLCNIFLLLIIWQKVLIVKISSCDYYFYSWWFLISAIA